MVEKGRNGKGKLDSGKGLVHVPLSMETHPIIREKRM